MCQTMDRIGVATRQEDMASLQTYDSAPGEDLPYECRIDWTPDGIEVVKQNALTYINSQTDDSTYYTDGPGDGNCVAAALVHQEEETIMRLNNSLLNASRHRKKSTIHTDSLTAVQTLTKKLRPTP